MSDFKRYLVSYRHEGARWNIELPARSFEDADARLRQLHFAKVDGEVMATIPASVGFLAPLIVWFRNLMRRA